MMTYYIEFPQRGDKKQADSVGPNPHVGCISSSVCKGYPLHLRGNHFGMNLRAVHSVKLVCKLNKTIVDGCLDNN